MGSSAAGWAEFRAGRSKTLQKLPFLDNQASILEHVLQEAANSLACSDKSKITTITILQILPKCSKQLLLLES